MAVPHHSRWSEGLHLSSRLALHWSYGRWSPETAQETSEDNSIGAYYRILFTHEIDTIARNTAKDDTMCAFYFAVQHRKEFRDIVYDYQKALERYTETLSTTQLEQDLTTGLLQDYENAKLLEEAQAMAQRLKIALKRIWKGDRHLPPWGPPLLPNDAPVEENDAWIFPAPWMVMVGKTSQDFIRVAQATPEDPSIRSRIIPLHTAARAGVPPANARFWSVDRSYTSPATVVCLSLAKKGAALAVSASLNPPRAGASSAVRTPGGTAPPGEAPRTTTTSSSRSAPPPRVRTTPATEARESNQYVPPPIIQSAAIVRAVPSATTATVETSARTNTRPPRRVMPRTSRSNVLATATPQDPARATPPLAAVRSGHAGRADPPGTTARRPETEGGPSKGFAERTNEQQSRFAKPKPSEPVNTAPKTGPPWPRWGARASQITAPGQPGDPPSVRQARGTREGEKPGDVGRKT